METIGQTINWTMGNGKRATVTVELQNEVEREINADGHEVTTTGRGVSIEVTGSVEGYGVTGNEVTRIDHPQVAGKCGNLGIPEEQMQQIEAAIAEAKATPEWTEHMARIENGIRQDREYEAHHAAVQTMMDA